MEATLSYGWTCGLQRYVSYLVTTLIITSLGC